MSNIYILEPPTSGKVLLKTTVGDIDIELWTKETPKACRNFIQLCMEGYYNGVIFHRVVKGFIVQGGDPDGDGTGGESASGEPFKDEFHQRLKFVRRGLVAMANAGKDANGSQFFFTLTATPELQNKHTIFGKVTGDTLFNMLKLSEGLIEDERPTYPHKIISTEVLNNPFLDIVPRIKEVKVAEKVKKPKVPGVKNFKLLSFGAEAEEDEEETKVEAKKFSGKSKSTHDILDDPKLSTDATQVKSLKNDAEEEVIDHELQLQNIRKKLKTENKKPIVKRFYFSDDEEEEQQENERQKRKDDILKEIKDVKREYHKNRLQKEKQKSEEMRETIQRNEVTEEYLKECDKYKETSNSFPKKGPGREQFTLNLLSKFKKKLESAKEKDNEEDEVEPEQLQNENEDEKWMTHKLHFEDGEPILAKDANTKGDDWFEIYDPRNPLNKRRRGETTTIVTRK